MSKRTVAILCDRRKKWQEMALIRALVLTLGCTLCLHAQKTSASFGAIVVTINGVRSASGIVTVGLFSGPKGFPDKGTCAMRRCRSVAQPRSMVIRLDSIPFGVYAIGLMHDENDNGAFDMKFFIPQEGFGASNDARGRFGPPRFNDAKFAHSDSITQLILTMRY